MLQPEKHFIAEVHRIKNELWRANQNKQGMIMRLLNGQPQITMRKKITIQTLREGEPIELGISKKTNFADVLSAIHNECGDVNCSYRTNYYRIKEQT